MDTASGLDLSRTLLKINPRMNIVFLIAYPWSDIFYFSINSAALLLSVLGLWFTIIVPSIGHWNKRFWNA